MPSTSRIRFKAALIGALGATVWYLVASCAAIERRAQPSQEPSRMATDGGYTLLDSETRVKALAAAIFAASRKDPARYSQWLFADSPETNSPLPVRLIDATGAPIPFAAQSPGGAYLTVVADPQEAKSLVLFEGQHYAQAKLRMEGSSIAAPPPGPLPVIDPFEGMPLAVDVLNGILWAYSYCPDITLLEPHFLRDGLGLQVPPQVQSMLLEAGVTPVLEKSAVGQLRFRFQYAGETFSLVLDRMPFRVNSGNRMIERVGPTDERDGVMHATMLLGAQQSPLHTQFRVTDASFWQPVTNDLAAL